MDSITHSMDMKSEQALRIVDAQGSLVCYSPWGGKEPDMTERLNWTELYEYYYYFFFYVCFMLAEISHTGEYL